MSNLCGNSLFCSVRRIGVGLILWYTGVVFALGGTAWAKPTLYALAFAWIAIVVIARDVPVPRALRLIEIIATNIAIALFLIEVMLRMFAACSGSPFVVNSSMETYRLTPGKDYGGGLRGNSLGYPGSEFQHEKRPGVYRIAALGDSFAIGPAVPFADNYLTRLEQSLPHVEVYNFGVAGIGPREYLSILQRDVWSFQPDLILLSVFVGNDITESLATPRHLDPRQHALYLLCQRAWRIARGTESPDCRQTSSADRLSNPPLSASAFRAIEARRLAVCFRSAPSGMEKKWERALAYLAQIADDCNRRGVPLAVVLIPDEFQTNPAVHANAMADAGVSASAVDIELPQRRLRSFFNERQVPCLDLLPVFPKTPDTYAVHDTHWNVAGNRLAADEMSKWLRCLPCYPKLSGSIVTHE